MDTANSKRETTRFAQELGSVDDDNNFEAPTFINVNKFPTTISRHSGETIQLKCPAEGNPQPNITWTKDGNVLSNEAKLKDRTWSIAVQSLVPNDAGQYTCHVCNEYGCIQFTTTVEVELLTDDTFERNLEIESQISEDEDDTDDNDEFQDEEKSTIDANGTDRVSLVDKYSRI